MANEYTYVCQAKNATVVRCVFLLHQLCGKQKLEEHFKIIQYVKDPITLLHIAKSFIVYFICFTYTKDIARIITTVTTLSVM